MATWTVVDTSGVIYARGLTADEAEADLISRSDSGAHIIRGQGRITVWRSDRLEALLGEDFDAMLALNGEAENWVEARF